MFSPESKRRVSSLALFAMPLIAVKIAAAVMGGPSRANAGAGGGSAGAPATDSSASALAKVEWSEQQRRAAEHIWHVQARPFGPAPMLYTALPAATPTPDPILEIVAPPDPKMPQLALQAVMAASGGNKALINGRLIQVGQSYKGWVVREIDADKRQVILAEEDGDRIVTIQVQIPN